MHPATLPSLARAKLRGHLKRLQWPRAVRAPPAPQPFPRRHRPRRLHHRRRSASQQRAAPPAVLRSRPSLHSTHLSPSSVKTLASRWQCLPALHWVLSSSASPRVQLLPAPHRRNNAGPRPQQRRRSSVSPRKQQQPRSRRRLSLSRRRNLLLPRRRRNTTCWRAITPSLKMMRPRRTTQRRRPRHLRLHLSPRRGPLRGPLRPPPDPGPPLHLAELRSHGGEGRVTSRQRARRAPGPESR